MENLSIVRTPQLIAAEIMDIKVKTQRMLLYNSIEIGRRLTEAKSLMEHGEWGAWLEQSVDYSKSTANNLMRIFEEYGADQITLLDNNVKNDSFSKLSYSQAVALLGMPEEEKEAFVSQNDVENMSTRDLQQAIKDKETAEEKAKKAEADAKSIKELTSKLSKDLRAAQDELLKEKKQREQEVKILADKLIKAHESGSQEEVKTLDSALRLLKDELEKTKARAAELEQQLKEKPIEAAATKEVIPPEVEKELEELRKKASPEIIKFTVCFESVKKSVADLALVLDEIKDAGTKEKYRGAAIKFLDIIKNKI